MASRQGTDISLILNRDNPINFLDLLQYKRVSTVCLGEIHVYTVYM